MRDLRDEVSVVMVKSRKENQTEEGGASQRAESKVKFIFNKKESRRFKRDMSRARSDTVPPYGTQELEL